MRIFTFFIVLSCISIFSFSQYENDLEIVEILPNYHFEDGGNYSRIPRCQVTDAWYGAVVRNNGSLTQHDITLSVTVEEPLIFDHSFVIDSLQPSNTDTIFVYGDLLHDDYSYAEYSIFFEVFQTEVEQDSSNNRDTLSFIINNSTYSKWINYNSNFSISDIETEYAASFIGSWFYLKNSQQVHSIRAFINLLTTPGTTIIPTVYNSDTIQVLEGEEYDIQSSDLGNWVYTDFNDLTGSDLYLDGEQWYLFGYELYCGHDTLSFLTDTNYYNSNSKTITRINGEWSNHDAIPLFDVTFDYLYCVPVNVISIEETVLSIYPNPSTDQVCVELPDEIQESEIIITNISGQEIYRKNVSGNGATIPVHTFSEGHYIVTVKAGSEVFSEKIVVY